jgi:hypothetical protein
MSNKGKSEKGKKETREDVSGSSYKLPDTLN